MGKSDRKDGYIDQKLGQETNSARTPTAVRMKFKTRVRVDASFRATICKLNRCLRLLFALFAFLNLTN